jgi:hypothetical protein
LVARHIVVLFAASLLMINPAAAGSIDPHDSVPGYGGITYLDLMKLVVPDLGARSLTGEPTAHRVVPYRHIEGNRAKTEPRDALAIKFLDALKVPSGGTSRLALLADLGESDFAVTEFTLLALFDLAAKPKLLDVVEVGTDHITGFTDQPLMPLGHGADLITVESGHFGGGLGYLNTELVLLRNGRFSLIAAIPTFRSLGCSYERTQTRHITTRPDPGSPYRRILAVVRETLKLNDDAASCSGEQAPKPFSRIFRATYRWNARRRVFATSSHDFAKLTRVIRKLNGL